MLNVCSTWNRLHTTSCGASITHTQHHRREHPAAARSQVASKGSISCGFPRVTDSLGLRGINRLSVGLVPGNHPSTPPLSPFAPWRLPAPRQASSHFLFPELLLRVQVDGARPCRHPLDPCQRTAQPILLAAHRGYRLSAPGPGSDFSPRPRAPDKPESGHTLPARRLCPLGAHREPRLVPVRPAPPGSAPGPGPRPPIGCRGRRPLCLLHPLLPATPAPGPSARWGRGARQHIHYWGFCPRPRARFGPYPPHGALPRAASISPPGSLARCPFALHRPAAARAPAERPGTAVPGHRPLPARRQRRNHWPRGIPWPPSNPPAPAGPLGRCLAPALAAPLGPALKPCPAR